MSKYKLKTCPFCGQQPRFYCENDLEDDFDENYFVSCNPCGIQVHGEYASEAMKLWNNRYNDPVPPVGWNDLDELQIMSSDECEFIDIFGKVVLSTPSILVSIKIDVLKEYVGWKLKKKGKGYLDGTDNTQDCG